MNQRNLHAQCRKMVDCSLRVGSELPPKVKEFKNVMVLFTREGKMKHNTDRQLVAVSIGHVPVDCCSKEPEPESKALNSRLDLNSNHHLSSQNDTADCRYKRPKLVSFTGWLSTPLSLRRNYAVGTL